MNSEGVQSMAASGKDAAHGFFLSTVATNPGMATIIMVALIIVIIILIILVIVYARRADSAKTKSGMGIRAYNPGLYNNARLGSMHAGMGGTMDSPTTPLQHAVIHPSQYHTAAVEQTHMHQGGDQEEIEIRATCGLPWDTTAVAEAQALVAVGGLTSGLVDGERELLSVVEGDEGNRPYSDDQLNSMLARGYGGYGNNGGYGGYGSY